jgi:MinD-like ATPase involved in chromosome partitioning or flagellar assembly/CheY-like chemotaxis protein
MLPKFNVLLIEDSPDSAKLVNHFLAASKIAEFRVATVGKLQAAREALGLEQFDAILLDLNLPDSRGIETYQRVRESARGAAIVVLTAVEDESVATTAIAQGAADYLVKGEVGGEGLARRVRFAVERNRAAVVQEQTWAGRVTVLLGAKGGAGVSTMAMNLAAALSRRERNVVLLELRPHGGSIATMLNLTSVLTIDTLAELGGPLAVDGTAGKLPFGPRLLAAPTGLDAGVRWDPAQVAALLEKVAASADHVLIDTSPVLGDVMKPAVRRASFTLMVVEREPVSIQMAARMTPTLTGWSGRPNAVGAALVNHMPFMDVAPLPSVRAELQCPIVGVLPPAREVLQSYRRQGPIVLAQPTLPIAMAFEELAGRLDQDPVQFVA